ncbi:AMP-dependent synthetase and ligase [Elusimicrobium minutum Pei191]|uniref:AMP-dependent synthetase and ligase n=1 Tax=Elusimicrobium minutum (strain Pei191) TaxID=445932 RepID=B2KDG9_ELUMP|nr:acyl-[ACP]--phospholipid O-acyltransferase [Elusimicrobium minutum]ACC98565.1 AMP-dependent synthetase and ligase [Elusimicrobium minutum Pei191]
MLKFWSLISNKGLSGNLYAHFFSNFNDNFIRSAFVALTLYSLSETTNYQQGLWMFSGILLFIIPFFIFTVFAGEVADKIQKNKLIKNIKTAEIIVCAMAILGLALGSKWLLLIVLLAKGTLSSFLGPVKYSILVDNVGKEKLLDANALMLIAGCAALFFGLISAPLFGYWGKTVILAFTAIMGLLSTLIIPDGEINDPGHKIQTNFLSLNITNFRLAIHSRDIFLCTFGIAWFWLIASVLFTQLQTIIIDNFAIGNKIFTYLFFIIIFAFSLGTVACRTLLKGEVNTRFAPLSFVLLTIFILDLAYVAATIPADPSIYLFRTFFFKHGIRISIDLFFTAFFSAIFVLPLHAMLQAAAHKQIRSRMLAVSQVTIAGFIIAASFGTFTLLKLDVRPVSILSMLALGNTFFAIGIVLLLPKHILRSVLTTILDFIYGVQFEGIEELRKNKGNAVIVANQNSLLDPLILAIYLPGRPYFAVDTETARKFWIRPFLKLIRYYVVDASNPMIIKSMIEEVKKGNKLVIFPEGRVSTTGGIMKIHPGLAMIAERSGADIIPVSIEGTQFSIFSRFGRDFKKKPERDVTVKISKPRKLNVNPALKGIERRAAADNALYDIMALMKFDNVNTNQTIFNSFINARYQIGYRFEIMEDINRKPVSYGKILTAAFVLGDKFTKTTKPGEFSGVFLPTSNACAITMLALHAYGRVPAMINFSTGIKNVCNSCKTAGIKTVFSAKVFIEKADMQPMVDALRENGINVIFIDEFKITAMNKILGLIKSFFPRFTYNFYTVMPKPTDPAFLLFTSGSEGSPKGVVLSHKNLLSNIAQVSSVLPLSVNDRIFCCMPLFHSFGLTAGFLLPALSGFKTFFYPSPLHYHVIPQLVYDTNSTILFATDTFLSGYAKTAHPFDFYSLRLVGMGAEKMKEETFNIWARKFGLRILELYGATETSPGIAFSTPMHFKLGSAGRILPGVDYRLEPVEGIESGGRLIVKGDNIMSGYIKADNPGVIQPPPEGWYDTGDIVDIDKEGFIFIKGRATRFAKVAGEMVPLLAVETEINNYWQDYQQALVSIPDEKRGEQLILFTTREDGSRTDLLKYFQQIGQPELFAPKIIEHIKEIPLIGTGKIDYITLTAMAKEKFLK